MSPYSSDIEVERIRGAYWKRNHSVPGDRYSIFLEHNLIMRQQGLERNYKAIQKASLLRIERDKDTYVESMASECSRGQASRNRAAFPWLEASTAPNCLGSAHIEVRDPISPLLCRVLSTFAPLCSHYLGLISRT
jgi:hypothetical protein